nr:MAG TPA: hypothetical protein [Bacteriophage sp.]
MGFYCPATNGEVEYEKNAKRRRKSKRVLVWLWCILGDVHVSRVARYLRAFDWFNQWFSQYVRKV